MNLSFFSSYVQALSCVRPLTTGLRAALNAVHIMNVYCSFVSQSLSALPVCVKRHYSLFLLLLDTHTNTLWSRGWVGIKGSAAHTTLMESRCREWAALLKLRWHSASANLCLVGGVKCYQARSMQNRGLLQQAKLHNWETVSNDDKGMEKPLLTSHLLFGRLFKQVSDQM